MARNMTDKINESVAVSGLGAVSAWGWGLDDLWRGLQSGRAAIAEPESFDVSGQRTRLASEVPDLPDDSPWAQRSAWRRWSRTDRFAVVAAVDAWRAAGLGESAGPADERVVGVFFGGSTAAMWEAETFFSKLTDRGAAHQPRIAALASHPLSSPGDAVARYLDVSGPVESVSSACASGSLAIGAALDALRNGWVDVAIAGGADSLCRLTYAGFNALRAVDSEPCSPFRKDRAGLSLGEGAGALVLERERDLKARGGKAIGRVLGAGASCDAHHMTAPHPQGDGAARAIRNALRDAGLDTDSVQFVNAHGTGTPLNDSAEWKALESVFGERARRIPVTSTKGLLGHCLGSSGAVEAVATFLCLQHGAVHVTPGRGEIDDALGVDLVVGEMRDLPDGAVAVSTSFAFGGSNGAVVLTGGGGA